MLRNIQSLTEQEFDLVIIGGGIFAATAAWDAALRGLSVALIEKHDFASGSSANSFKFIHGGIRYLQHADIVRLRASCRERSAMLRIAPHLVQPQPVLIPTYGHGKSGKWFLGAGMLVYDLLTLGRNRGIRDKKRRIPWSSFFSRRQVLQDYPDLNPDGLTGAAMFSDAQMYNPTRLVLAFIQSAVSRGAVVANYVEAQGLLRDGDCVTGVQAFDRISQQAVEIRAKAVLNCAGPWSDWLLEQAMPQAPSASQKNVYSRDACFVIKRRFDSPRAVAVLGRTKDPDALLSRPARHLFLVPWRDYTLVGVWHVVWKQHPETVTVEEQEVQTFIDEINEAYPALQLTTADVCMWNAGLVPFGDNEEGDENLSYGKRSLFIDHKASDGIDGLVTLIGIRYTTARGDSARAVDLICRKLGHQARAQTETTPLQGGDIADFDALVQQLHQQQTLGLPYDCVEALAHNHGANATGILALAQQDAALAERLGGSRVLKAEVINAVQNEMALTLADVVFRRTDLATGGNPGKAALQQCIDLMTPLLGWDEAEQQAQMQAVLARFPQWNQQESDL